MIESDSEYYRPLEGDAQPLVCYLLEGQLFCRLVDNAIV
jgi:hypothetical protein